MTGLDVKGSEGFRVQERRRERRPQTATSMAPIRLIFGVLDIGAAGYLTKQEPLDHIMDVIHGVARDETGWLSRRIAVLFIDRHRARNRQGKELLGDLSEREREVLHLLALGHTDDEIDVRGLDVEKRPRRL